MSASYEKLFPRAAKHVVLIGADAKNFERFAIEIHEYGFDWWFADDTACWGRREPGQHSARIRLGRLGISRDGAYVTVSVKTNGKEVLLRDHGVLLASLGTLQQGSRFVIPMDRAIDLFKDDEFLQSLIELAPPRERAGFWESDYSEDAAPPSIGWSSALTNQLDKSPNVIGCPPGSSERRMVYVRKGHQAFRRGVVKHWGGQCAVRGAVDTRLLIASHIVPWAEADDKEKTDPENGLLLSSPLDALFDLGLISFDDGGVMLIGHLDVVTKQAFGLNEAAFSLRDPDRLLTDKMKKYLKRHRATHQFSSVAG